LPSAISAKRATPDKARGIPIALFGTEYWREIIDFDALARPGTIDAKDIELMHQH